MRHARPEWGRRALAACARWLDGARPPLRSRLSAVLARGAKGRAAGSLEDTLTNPFATSYFAFTEAFRKDLDLPDEGAIDSVGEGAVALYFYLRIQDDIVDEPEVFDPSYLYAAEVFAGASAEAFARAAGSERAFWAFRRAALDELASASAWELDTYRKMDPKAAGEHAEEHAAELGNKLAPVSIPLAALVAAARKNETRGADFFWLLPFVQALGCALQIANDLLNAREDHEAGRLTPALSALYAGGRVAPDDEAFRVWPALASDSALDRMQRAARQKVESAFELALRSNAPALAAAVRESAALLDELAPRLLKLSLGVPA